MKLKVALLGTICTLAFASAAEAYYYIPFGKARKYSKLWVREACEARGPSCLTWKVGHCKRFTQQRIDCAAGILFRTESCTFIVENRVGVYGSGVVKQRRRQLRCRAI